MTGRRTLAALLVATALSTVGASVGVAAPALAATASKAVVVVAPDDGGVVHSGKPLGVTVTVRNPGVTALGRGRLTFSLDAAPVANTAMLLSSTPPEALQGQLTSAAADVPELGTGATERVRATLGAKDLSLLSKVSGASRLYVQYLPQNGPGTIAVSSVVRIASRAKASIGLAAVIPVLAPSGTTGTVDVAAQQQLVGPDGAWGRALRAAEADPAAAVELDPAVLASIRLAGAAAPPEVTDFLDRLGRLPNEFLRLPYADADVTLERAAGSSVAEPSSFSGVTLPVPSTGGPTPAPTATAGTTATTAADLTAWGWSDRVVTWPVPGTTSSSDLAAFGRTGQVLLSSDDLQDTAARRAGGPLARAGASRVLVSDATTSSLLAAASADGPAGASALAALTGLLATDAVTGATPALLATVGRTTDMARLDQVLALLQRQGWIHPTTLTGLGDGADAAAVRIGNGSVPGSRAGTARSLLSAEGDVEALGKAVLTGADTVTAPQRLALLGALSASWRGDDTGWRAAVTSVRKRCSAVVGEVQLAKQSPPNLIGSDGTLAVYVVNGLAVPVRITVHAGVSNGAVQFTDPSVTIVVPAGGRAPARLAFRSIRNGRTDLTLSLSTPSGTPIGSEVVRSASVQAGFDTIVAVALLSALGLLLALGVYRNVTRRRRPRAAVA